MWRKDDDPDAPPQMVDDDIRPHPDQSIRHRLWAMLIGAKFWVFTWEPWRDRRGEPRAAIQHDSFSAFCAAGEIVAPTPHLVRIIIPGLSKVISG